LIKPIEDGGSFHSYVNVYQEGNNWMCPALEVGFDSFDPLFFEIPGRYIPEIPIDISLKILGDIVVMNYEKNNAHLSVDH
jgi:hypothetical protein